MCCFRIPNSSIPRAESNAVARQIPRAGDIRDSQADVSLAKKVLGYAPLVMFEEGLKRMWDSYKAAYANDA